MCVVTSGTGFVGTRLVEMLVERGAARVVSFDVVPLPQRRVASSERRVAHRAVDDLLSIPGIKCVWQHNAAAVGC